MTNEATKKLSQSQETKAVMQLTTTLNRILDKGPCYGGWVKLLLHLGKTQADDEPLPFSVIMASNGLDDALWCCRSEPQHANIWRNLAVDFAETVRHLMTDSSSLDALKVARRHANGEATDDELANARLAVWCAASAAKSADLAASGAIDARASISATMAAKAAEAAIASDAAYASIAADAADAAIAASAVASWSASAASAADAVSADRTAFTASAAIAAWTYADAAFDATMEESKAQMGNQFAKVVEDGVWTPMQSMSEAE